MMYGVNGKNHVLGAYFPLGVPHKAKICCNYLSFLSLKFVGKLCAKF